VENTLILVVVKVVAIIIVVASMIEFDKFFITSTILSSNSVSYDQKISVKVVMIIVVFVGSFLQAL
jgi:hypothetical protein